MKLNNRQLNNFFIITLVSLFILSCKTRHFQEKNPLINSNGNTPDFANQGEQENYWAKLLFEKRKTQKFNKYKGTIKIIDDTHLQYGEVLIGVFNCDTTIKKILTEGILYPQLISPGSFRITNVEEQPFLSNSIKIKRFRFLLWYKNLLNPTVYFFELYNKKASAETSLKNFIYGSKLTFIGGASVQI